MVRTEPLRFNVKQLTETVLQEVVVQISVTQTDNIVFGLMMI